MKHLVTHGFVLLAVIIFSAAAFSLEEAEYRKFKLDDVSGSVGILYRTTDDGMDVGVSAIGTGKGSEFRRWEVTDIRLRIDGEAVRPDSSEKYFVKKESFFRVPAAIVFAALGTQVSSSGSGLQQGITKAGVAIGLGLLVLQAEGDITGLKCIVPLDRQRAEKINSARDTIEITIENKEIHLKEVVKMPLSKAALIEEERNKQLKSVQEEMGKLQGEAHKEFK